jgi:hypothetical protein
LHSRKHQEVDGGEEAEVAGAQVQLGHQIAGDQRVDGAEQIGQVIAGGERQQH